MQCQREVMKPLLSHLGHQKALWLDTKHRKMQKLQNKREKRAKVHRKTPTNPAEAAADALSGATVRIPNAIPVLLPMFSCLVTANNL